jgi:hypothetical protein
MVEMILKLLCVTGALSLSFSLQAQDKPGTTHRFVPTIKNIHHRLGDSHVTIQALQYGNSREFVFVNLHDNENTAVSSAKKVLEKRGGLLLKISNNSKRDIRFKLSGKYYTFDPNRIFSPGGIDKTLRQYGRHSRQAARELKLFADRLVNLIPDEMECLVALHNNSDEGFSVTDYLPGNEKAIDAKESYIASGQDKDDFLITTDSVLYRLLCSRNYNTVWQDNECVTQDGSLSVYFGQQNRRYINCETEHGKSAQYREMMEIIFHCLEEAKQLSLSNQ